MRWFLVNNNNNRALPLAAVLRVALKGKILMVGLKGISERQRCSWKQLLTVTAAMLTTALLKATMGKKRRDPASSGACLI
jgi:hypothetical protein